MADRLSSADLAFLYLESRTTPQHVGTLLVVDAPTGFDYDRLVRLLDERIPLAPRYRQRLQPVPGRLAAPVWVDDPNFDLTYHVRRSALPRPGGEGELLDFCARILARVLDRDRPLWEMYLVEGLAGGKVAIVTKTHPSMIDGGSSIDITQVLLDQSPEPRRTVEQVWMPQREPSPARLVREALVDTLRRPAAVVDTLRWSTADARGAVRGPFGQLGGGVGGLLRLVTDRDRHDGPLTATLSQHRRIALARTRLADFRTVRRRHGGTVNDVVLAVVTGALRAWLIARHEPLTDAMTVRALVPVGVEQLVAPEAGDDLPGRPGGSVVPLLVDLPVGDPDPLRRLRRIGFAMAGDPSGGAQRFAGADALVAMSGFAPPTLQSLGARAAYGLARRTHSIAVTNTPGPQVPLYAAGARLAEMFPVPPLTEGHAVAIGLTSYDGGVFFGVNADREAVPDVELVTAAIGDCLAELVALRASVPRRSGGRR